MYCTDLQRRIPRPVCSSCDKCLAKVSDSVKMHGKLYFNELCTGCMHEKNHGKRHPFVKHHKYSRPWIVHKKDICEKCKFKAQHSCQLDVDHIDGNKYNNSPDNLQTLCANCHRLKTMLNKDSTGQSKNCRLKYKKGGY